MTSDRRTPDSAFVWVWLPGQTEAVVAGRITSEGGRYAFNYGASYLDRANAIPLYTPELPLQRGRIDPPPNMEMASCLRDGSPDAWGRTGDLRVPLLCDGLLQGGSSTAADRRSGSACGPGRLR
ncbi:hypothetical protein EV663_12510 [Rhodovulum bhavnagarense]|uniref:HipA-like protein n=1 Tax=Rhodovulum bhavnagarense TaxID=992286 RepID=A0A4R2R791_9RHOB|nr:hypothetical protein EV663_12510 [Rhodovulum bhavnagarense]